jgi:arginine N-succinyltransferase
LERNYLFVIVETASNKIVGSCQVIAQHGTKDAPHIFLEVYTEEHYSKTLDKLIEHQVVRLGFNYDGPTEVGGLIVDPEYRTIPEKLGKQLSLMRFLFIAANRSAFKNQVLAEMMPPMPEPGKPVLWDAFGKRFTTLSYLDADFRSRTSKEFVKALLPDIPIYTCLFDESVQKSIGAVAKETEPAVKMLQAIGLEYNSRVDPFDGGPHLQGATDRISVVRETRMLEVVTEELQGEGVRHGLVLSCKDMFTPKADARCIACDFVVRGKNVALAQESAQALDVTDGDTVYVYDFNPASA